MNTHTGQELRVGELRVDSHDRPGAVKTCITLTIEELQHRIQKLTLAVQALQELEPQGTAEVPPPPCQDGNGKPERPSPGRVSVKRAAGGRKPPAGSRSAALEQARRMVTAATGMEEPLTAKALAKAAGLADDKPAYGIFYRWLAAGWVSRVGPGEYKRTKQFPKSKAPATPAAPGRLSIPGLDPEPLAARLEQARAELAEAKARGNMTLANIFEHKVKKLSCDLEAA